MFCHKCGVQVADDALFCGKCGTRLADEPVAAAQAIDSADTQGVDTVVADQYLDALAQPVATTEVFAPVGASAEVRRYAPSNTAATSAPAPQAVQAEAAPAKKTPGWAIAIIALLVAILAAGVVYIAFSAGNKKAESASQELAAAEAKAEEAEKRAEEAEQAAEEAAQAQLDTQADAKDVTIVVQAPDGHRYEEVMSSVQYGSFVLPDSSGRYYSESQLQQLTNWELYIARNEIFARYGRGFNDEALRNYFNSCDWYYEIYSPKEFDSMASPLNKYEKANVEVMLDIEQRRNSPYLP